MQTLGVSDLGFVYQMSPDKRRCGREGFRLHAKSLVPYQHRSASNPRRTAVSSRGALLIRHWRFPRSTSSWGARGIRVMGRKLLKLYPGWRPGGSTGHVFHDGRQPAQQPGLALLGLRAAR